MMQLAQINLPMQDNTGKDTLRARTHVQQKVLVAFGGATVWQANGAWVNHAGRMFVEPVAVIQIAADWDARAKGGEKSNACVLRQIAKAFAKDADQEAVFIALPSGVELIRQDDEV